MGICHRDIHSGNIMYDNESKSVKIIDFSIARKLDKLKKVKMMTKTGNPYFRAPEMLMC